MRSGKDAAGNRAVSALFRVFGGSGRRVYADGFERTRFGAMHAGERLVLGWLIPLTVFVALSEWLLRGLGGVVGLLVLLPVGFILLNLLAYGVPGRKVTVQWWLWLLLLTGWAWWRKDAGGYISWFSWLWLGIFAANACAHLILGLGAWMKVTGSAGVALRIALFLGLHVILWIGYLTLGWIGVALGGGVMALLFCLSVLCPTTQWLGPIVCFREGEQPLITIDDGPCPEETPQLLDLLDRYERKAIFFVIGEKVASYPDLAREIVKRGHELGNHTMTHPQASFWCAGPRRTRREISECQKVIATTTGVIPRYFRAPVGHRNLFTHPIAGEFNLQVIAWSRRGYDGVEKDSAKVLEKILPVRNGDIALMHEGNGISATILKGILENLPGKVDLPKLPAGE